jgi:hypothetical protein
MNSDKTCTSDRMKWHEINHPEYEAAQLLMEPTLMIIYLYLLMELCGILINILF